MGLFSAIKNVLFEEETVEIPVVNSSKEKKEDEILVSEEPKIIKKTIEEPKKEEIIPDHDLYKSEKTFDFPMFDEKEFDEVNSFDDEFDDIEEKPRGLGINLFDHDRPKDLRNNLRAPSIKGRAYDEKSTEGIKNRKFSPSPVISPVYGVLDKNYHKEDIVVASKSKKSINVDDVRKKAFGKIKDDIENTLDDIPVFDDTDELDLPKKEDNFDELLEKTITDSIPITDTKEIEVVNNKTEVIEEKNNKEVSDETLENDLFDLIDSMYEDKEDIE